MTALPIALGVLATIAALAWLWVQFKNAPEGWEDSDGWHAGRPDDREGE